ncbi:hypothetical protein Tco_0027485 [Tanacetum coccineum]
MGAAVLTGLAVLIDVAALGELCLAALTGTCPDFVTTTVGTKFLLGCGGCWSLLDYWYSFESTVVGRLFSTLRGSCGELDAQPTPPDEGVMVNLRS